MKVTVNVDGACEPVNPGGIATYGFVIRVSSSKVLEKNKGVIGVLKRWFVRFRNPNRKIDKLLSAHKSTFYLIPTGRMPARIGFTDEQIEEMVMMYRYGFSAPEIAKWFDVGSNTIYRRLRERNVRIRPPAPLRDENPLYVQRNIPDPWTDADAAYVFGVLIGDASISRRGDGVPSGIVNGTPDDQFATVFSEAVEAAFEIEAKNHSDKENHPVVAAYSVDLGKAYDGFKWRKKTWRIPEPFFDAPKDIKIALCQGKLDSDGTIDKKAIVTIAICKKGLEDLERVVSSCGYKATVKGPYPPPPKWGKKKQYKLRIVGASPQLFRLPRKRKKLQGNYRLSA